MVDDSLMKVSSFLVGVVIFIDAEEFKFECPKYSIARGVEIAFKKNEPSSIRIIYTYSNYPRLCYGSKDKGTEDFKIKTYNPKHRCLKQFKSKRVT